MAIGKSKKVKKGGKKKVIDPFLRKEWYDLRAPAVFAQRNFGKTIVSRTAGTRLSSDSLRGRVIEVSLADLQKDEEYSFRKMKLQIQDIQGRTCLTSFYGMDFTSDKIRSIVKKWTSRVSAIADFKTVDGYVLRLFVVAYTKRRNGQICKNSYAQTVAVKKLRARMFKIMENNVTKSTVAEVVNKLMHETMGKEIEKTAEQVYPVSNVFVHKVKIVKAPKFEAAALLAAHTDAPKAAKEDVGSKL